MRRGANARIALSVAKGLPERTRSPEQPGS
jgi:hypothetical protein